MNMDWVVAKGGLLGDGDKQMDEEPGVCGGLGGPVRDLSNHVSNVACASGRGAGPEQHRSSPIPCPVPYLSVGSTATATDGGPDGPTSRFALFRFISFFVLFTNRRCALH